MKYIMSQKIQTQYECNQEIQIFVHLVLKFHLQYEISPDILFHLFYSILRCSTFFNVFFNKQSLAQVVEELPRLIL